MVLMRPLQTLHAGDAVVWWSIPGRRWKLDALRTELRKRPAEDRGTPLRQLELTPGERVWCTQFERLGRTFVAGVRQLQGASSWGAYVVSVPANAPDGLVVAREAAERCEGRFMGATADAHGSRIIVEAFALRGAA